MSAATTGRIARSGLELTVDRDLADADGDADVVPARSVADRELSVDAAALVAEALAPNTRRAYRRWVARWDTWCATTGRTALPGTAESLASWVAVLAAEGQSPSSIGQAIGAVRSAHALAGHPDTPGKATAAKALRAHRRRRTDAGHRARQAAPLVVEHLVTVVDRFDPQRVIDVRDRALLVVGFTGCLRRSTLVALDRADLVVHRDRLEVTIRRSKTDQDGVGRVVDLPLGSRPGLCPVRAVEAWLALLDQHDHPHQHDGDRHHDQTHDDQQAHIDQLDRDPGASDAVFRAVDKAGRISSTRLSTRSVARVVARRVGDADLAGTRWSGHSLRAGGATSMAAAGATTSEIAEHGGWSPTSGVVHAYVRRHEAWRRNPMRSVL